MYFIIFNLLEVSNIAQKPIDPRQQLINSRYFLFLQKICPLRMEAHVLTFPTAISKFRKKFQISPDQARDILKTFIETNILSVGYEDKLEMDILANTTRKEILALVSKYPGLYVNLIRSHLQLGTNQTLWHLNFLVEFEYISLFKIGKAKVYSEKNSSKTISIIGFFILKKTIRQILVILTNHSNGLYLDSLIKLTSRNRRNLNYTLDKLMEWKIIAKKGQFGKYQINFKHVANIMDLLTKFNSIFSSNMIEAS